MADERKEALDTMRDAALELLKLIEGEKEEPSQHHVEVVLLDPRR